MLPLQRFSAVRICRLTCEGDAMRDDDAAILEARATGRSVERIAREFRTTPEAVNKVLDAYVVELLAEPNLRRTLMLELFRLDELLQTFYAKAKAGDYRAGVLCTKISQRRSCLLGLDPQVGYAVTVINNNGPQVHQSTTVTLHGMLDDVMGVTWRERN
jgi:hypothetical protein